MQRRFRWHGRSGQQGLGPQRSPPRHAGAGQSQTRARMKRIAGMGGLQRAEGRLAHGKPDLPKRKSRPEGDRGKLGQSKGGGFGLFKPPLGQSRKDGFGVPFGPERDCSARGLLLQLDARGAGQHAVEALPDRGLLWLQGHGTAEGVLRRSRVGVRQAAGKLEQNFGNARFGNKDRAVEGQRLVHPTGLLMGQPLPIKLCQIRGLHRLRRFAPTGLPSRRRARPARPWPPGSPARCGPTPHWGPRSDGRSETTGTTTGRAPRISG